MSAPPPADDAPPPAYSEEELDTKISQAIEESLRLDAKGAPHDNAADEWEEWDEALFEANCREAQSPGAGSSSSAASPRLAYEETLSSASTAAVSPPMSTASGSSSGSSSVGRMPTVRPLRLHRPSPSVTSSGGTEKPRPSWYAEAGLGRPSESSESSRNPLPVPPPPPLPAELRQPQTPPTDDDAPPAFTPVGPSLDGPAYEEVVHLEYHVPESQASSPLTSPVILPQDSAVRLSYEGPQDLGQDEDSEDEVDSMPAPPPPPLPRVRGPRTAPAPQSRFSDPVPQALVGIPRVQFNPSLAYRREEGVGAMEQAPAPAPPPKGDAMAFYNSAVSSVLKPRTAPHVPASVNNRYSMLPPGAAAPAHPHHLSMGYGDHPSQSNTQSWFNPVPVHAPVASYPPSAPQFYQHR
ncbi:hypothetical protein EV715DRAFT_204252 [Schizophyllum commune]